MEKNEITLKFGNLKSFDFPVDSDEAIAAVDSYEQAYLEHEEWGPEREALLCKVIDFCEDGQIFLWWEQKYATKEEAKQYVADYFKNKRVEELEKKKVEEQPKKKSWLKTIFGS